MKVPRREGKAPQTEVRHVLFVCGKNRWRSPTAEEIFADHPGITCLSAGLSHDAETVLTPELVDWADQIFVMERVHKTKLAARFREQLSGKRVICLDVPDRFQYMDPALVTLLKAKVTPHLPAAIGE